MANPGNLYDWIEALPEGGRYVFSRADAASVTSASDAAIKMTLYRLKRSGAIISPRRDFFVIVPREYRSAGSPPATWFIDDLLGHLSRRYYVALLSAAALHGVRSASARSARVRVGRPGESRHGSSSASGCPHRLVWRARAARGRAVGAGDGIRPIDDEAAVVARGRGEDHRA